MPAVLRGAAPSRAKPRAKAPASSKARKPAKAQERAYQPAKLGAARGVGLSPKHAMFAAAAVLGVVGLAALVTGHRAEHLATGVNHSLAQRMGGLGFRLKAVHVQGATPMATADILKATGAYKDEPVMDLDLEALRQRVKAVGWVKEARVIRLLPDTLVLAVEERKQLAVWQSGGISHVIDETGFVIPEANPMLFPNLPLIVGAGANEFAAQILPEVMSRPRLAERVEALVRVDNRRWDLRLKDGSLIQLPAVDEAAAFLQLEQLDQRSRILELGFERIDLRDPSVVAVRPRDGALPGQLVANGV